MKKKSEVQLRKAKKQMNRHARSKQKRRALRLKNFFQKVESILFKKKMGKNKPKGTTIVGRAIEYARYVELKENETARYPNQRQKRKKWRQNPNARKAA